MTLDTLMLLAAGIFLLIQVPFWVGKYRRYRRLHCPIVPTKLNESVINIDTYRPERQERLHTTLGQPAAKGWDARKVHRGNR